jgi:cysteine desulfurase
MAIPRVYLDNNATTPLRPEILSELPRLFSTMGNASSLHEEGRAAKALVEQAREEVAALIGAKAGRIIFTSGGSESNNTVFSLMPDEAKRRRRDRILVSAVEHPCVERSAARLSALGLKVEAIPVDERGIVRPEALKAMVGKDCLLVSIMAANNETGSVNDVTALREIASAAGALFHTDAVQAAGKIPFDVSAIDPDYASLSAHKIYGPKGVGALYVRRGSPMEAFIRGGHQEHGFRAGTYNTPAIAGFGMAATLARAELPAYAARVRALRDRLKEGLLAAIPGAKVNGDLQGGLPNTLNMSFPGAEGEAILLYLDMAGIAVSTGSACASGSLEPSPVLLAMGLGPELAHGSIRFSLGRQSTEEEIEYCVKEIPPVIARVRAMSTVGGY